MIIKRLKNRFHVSNRAALLAALILTITSYVGFADAPSFEQKLVNQAVVASIQADDQSAGNHHPKPKLSISLLLFGRG